MEERKLNFNAPLLSVRRSSARTASSNGENAKKNENSRRNRLRTLASCKADSSLDQVTEPVAIPFHWEQIPGRRKNSNIPNSRHHQEDFVAPHHSPRKSALDVLKLTADEKPEYQDEFRPQVQANSFGGKLDCLNQRVNDKAAVDSEKDDDVYSDALDTLSATDSFSVHCSVSGLGGFGNLAIVKPSGTFATDPQIRDFMMSRFLPAAKAMTMEQPHYFSRNKPGSGEQPRQITNFIQRDRKPSVVRNESLHIVPYHEDIEDEQSEVGGDEYSDSGSITTKGCALLPRLCIKNSLCLLNPVPGMKLRAKSAVTGMKVRTQNSISSSRDSHGAKRIGKAPFARSQSPNIKRPTRDAVKAKREDDGRSPRLARGENKVACGSNRLTIASELQMIGSASPFWRSGVISPCRNEVPQSSFHGPGFLGVPKEQESFKNSKCYPNNKVYSKSHELVPYHAIRRSSRPASPTVEKTLYVDTVNAAGILYSNSGSSNVKKGSVGCAEKDLNKMIKIRRVQHTAASEISVEDVKCWNVSERGLASSNGTGMSPNRGQSDFVEDLSQDSKALVCIRTGASRNNVNTSSDQHLNEDDTMNAKTSLVACPPPPLLPKTPSESWLWRTLPTISSHNPLNRGFSFQSKRQDPNISANTKWENIVKSSYLHHDHVRYSEELFPHASQQSKS